LLSCQNRYVTGNAHDALVDTAELLSASSALLGQTCAFLVLNLENP
jgi:hypothetical protein